MRFPAAALTLVFLLTSSSVRAATLRVPSECGTIDAAFDAWAVDDTVIIETANGLVIGYGEVVDPPYEFSGIGETVLYLNGRQYFPRPFLMKDDRPELVPTPEVMEQTRIERTLWEDALSRTEDIPLPQRLEHIAQICLESGLVTKAEVIGESVVRVQWPNPRHGSSSLSFGPVPTSKGVSPESQRAHHDALIEAFWWLIEERDGALAFGDDYFTRSAHRDDVDGTRRVMRKLAEGTVPTEGDWQGSILASANVVTTD